MNVLGISGSLRTASNNSGLLRAARELAQDGVTIEPFERMAELPLFNEDVRLAAPPEVVGDLKQRVTEADAILLAVAEYNYGPSGVLKNAIDWISRPPAENPLRGKPVALMGAGGRMGTARAQLGIRQTLLGCGSLTLVSPEVMIPITPGAFDQTGDLVDPEQRERIAALVEALRHWVERVATG